MTSKPDLRAIAKEISAQAKPNGQATIPQIVALKSPDFMAMKLPVRTMFMSPWLAAQSLTMIFAARGTGKTYLLMSIALALAAGKSFLRWQVPGPLRVLYVEGELPARLLQDRFAALGGAHPNLTIINPELQPDLFLPHLAMEEMQLALDPIVEAHDVTFLDSLATLAPCPFDRDSENWSQLQPWFLAIRRRGKALAFAHHTNQKGLQRGISAREDVLDTSIKLEDLTEEDDRSCHFRVTYEKTRQFNPAGDPRKLFEPFEAHLVNGQWTATNDNSDQMLAVADLTLEGKTIRKIAEITGLPRMKVNRLQKQARERGTL